MKEAPWLQEQVVDLVAMLLRRHRAIFGSPLWAGADPETNPHLAAQEVFAADQAVLAHDGGADPQLVYANATALRLWQRSWEEMIGLPSRFTAEPTERHERALALALAQQQEGLQGYGGIRVDSARRRFRIEGAKLWTLRDEQGLVRGQAASFANWWWL